MSMCGLCDDRVPAGILVVGNSLAISEFENAVSVGRIIVKRGNSIAKASGLTTGKKYVIISLTILKGVVKNENLEASPGRMPNTPET